MAFQVEASLLSVRIVLEGWPLVQNCLYHFYPKRGLWLKSVIEKWVIFGQHASRHQSKMISKYHGLGTCVFGHRGVLTGLKLSKSWCIPNYQLSVFFKNSSFLLPNFGEFEKKFLNREFYGQMPEQEWSNGLFDFSKLCLLRHHVFFYSNDSIVKKNVY